VVNDCLKICQNILTDSETCQRLFYAMGNQWIIRLAEFFNPGILEKLNQPRLKSSLTDDSEGGNNDGQQLQQQFWFQDSGHLSCAISAISVLYVSLLSSIPPGPDATDENLSSLVVNTKHQNMILDTANIVLNYAAHWIARCGPTEILNPSFSLILAIIYANQKNAHFISQLNLKITPNTIGKNIPFTVTEIGTLEYGWRPLQQDETKYISFLSLLAERYILPIKPWLSNQNIDVATSNANDEASLLDIPLLSTFTSSLPAGSSTSSKYSLEKACLLLFEQIISIDTTICDLIIQSILAPPPQLLDDEHSEESQHRPMEMMKPLGFILVSTILDNCEKLFHSSNPLFFTNQNKLTHSGATNIETVERCLHVLTNIYLHGSQLSHELTTAITTNHIRLLKDKKHLMSSSSSHLLHHDSSNEVKVLLPYLLASVGKAARLPGGIGYNYIIAILQLLSIIACDCERATHQMFEDPSNLFVVDLATASSELAGVPSAVQAMACLFLGCCFCGFPDEKPPDSSSSANPPAADGNGSLFSRRSFISMIENKITINRFLETLKKPILHYRKGGYQHSHSIHSLPVVSPTDRNAHMVNYYDHLFILPGFKKFYDKQIEIIRSIIMDLFYGASASHMTGDAFTQQLIAMQQEKIKELEAKLQGKGGEMNVVSLPSVPFVPPAASDDTANKYNEQVIQEYQQTIAHLEQENSHFLEQQRNQIQQVEMLTQQNRELLNQQNSLQFQVQQLQQNSPKQQPQLVSPGPGAEQQGQLIRSLEEKLHFQQNAMLSLEQTLQTKEFMITDLKEQLEEMDSLKRMNSELEHTQFDYRNQLLEKETECSNLQRSLNSLQSDFNLFQQKYSLTELTNQEAMKEKENYKQNLQQKENEILQLKEKFNHEFKEKNELIQRQQEQGRKIELYEKEIVELKKISSSTPVAAATPATPQRDKPATTPTPATPESNAASSQQKLELEKYKINYQILVEAYMKLNAEMETVQTRLIENYLEKVVDPLTNSVIVMNLQDEKKSKDKLSQDENEEEEDDLDASLNLIESDEDVDRELFEHKTEQEKDCQLLKAFKVKLTQWKSTNASAHEIVHTPTIIKKNHLLPPSSTHPTFFQGVPLPIHFDFSLHSEFYDLIHRALNDNIMILEETAARCSDYAEGSHIKSLQGSEGSLLRILDCCKQLNYKDFQTMHVTSNYSQLLENYDSLQQQYNELQESVLTNNNAEEINETWNKKIQEMDESYQTLLHEKQERETIFLNEMQSQRTAWDNEKKQLFANLSKEQLTFQENLNTQEKLMSQVHALEQEILQLNNLVNQLKEESGHQLSAKESETQKSLTTLTEEYEKRVQDLHQKEENEKLNFNNHILSLQQQIESLSQSSSSEKETIEKRHLQLAEEKQSLEEELTKQSHDYEKKMQELNLQESSLRKSFEGEKEKLLKSHHEKTQNLQKTIEDLQKINKQNNDELRQLSEENESLREKSEKQMKDVKNRIEEMEEIQENYEMERDSLLKQVKGLLVEKEEILQKSIQMEQTMKLQEGSQQTNQKFQTMFTSFSNDLMNSFEEKLSFIFPHKIIPALNVSSGSGEVEEPDIENHNYAQENYFILTESKWSSFESFLHHTFTLILEKFSSYQQELNEKTLELSGLMKNLQEKETSIRSLQQELKHKSEHEVLSLQHVNQQLTSELEQTKQIISAQNHEINQLSNSLALKEQEMQEAKSSHYLNNSLTMSSKEVQRLTQANEKHIKECKEKEQELSKCKSLLSLKSGELEGMKMTLSDLKNDIKQLQEELNQLNTINEKLRKGEKVSAASYVTKFTASPARHLTDREEEQK
jgi:chromosome segregation ATPase